MYGNAIYGDKTYGDHWSTVVYTFTSSGGILAGGLTLITFFNFYIVGESRPAGSLCTESRTPLKMDKCN